MPKFAAVDIILAIIVDQYSDIKCRLPSLKIIAVLVAKYMAGCLAISMEIRKNGMQANDCCWGVATALFLATNFQLQHTGVV